jgi:DNA gyrase subunit A
MSVLRHVDFTTEERDEYLQAVHAKRRLAGSDYEGKTEEKARDEQLAAKLQANPRFQEMEAAEEFLLSMTEDGMGKRTSAYEYRIAGRGGQGVVGIETERAGGKKSTKVVAAFPVKDSDQLVMVSDGGQIIRLKVEQISTVGRSARGVTLFSTSDEERVVSVSRLSEEEEEEGEATGASMAATPPGASTPVAAPAAEQASS